ncbi:MAG: molybdenum cofactor biosynthesis protein B [Gammaproteobacteria bacterium]|nr:molybdenum cofactor biosynthesis protein B [Gammaproteobacteria bacterium]
MSQDRDFIALDIAVLTASDSRDEASDKSGALLVKLLEESGHKLAQKAIVPDDKYRIREVISRWIVDESIQVIVTTGGTGVTGRDGTPEAVTPLLDKIIDGFGETFRNLSYQTIGTSTLQSRALAGVANGTYIFCLPGSSGACKDAWNGLISSQLDYRTRPCNLVELMPRLREQ